MALTGTNIIGRIALPDDTNPVNSVVRFIMTGFDTDDTENATIIQIPIDATIDALGDIDVNLWPNPLGVRSTFYATYVRIPDGNTNDVINVYVGQISVPATGGPYDLNDLLPITPPAGADVADYIAQLAAAVALAESAAGGAFAAAAEVSATNAAISEANAAISEVASGSSANAAAVSATSAELSAIAAGAAIYADTTAGLAATVSGDVFLVPDANGMIVYENDTGVAVSLGRFRPAIFDSISELATSLGATVGQFATVNSGANGESEGFKASVAGALTADGALIVDGVGVQWISQRRKYATDEEFQADLRPDNFFSDGEFIGVAGPFGYTLQKVSTGERRTTDGGAKWKVLPSVAGYNVLAYGARADYDVAAGTGTNNSPYFQAALDDANNSALLGSSVQLVFAPAGRYLISTSLDATDRIAGCVIRGSVGFKIASAQVGTRLYGNTGDVPVIDMLGTQHGRLEQLAISTADNASNPSTVGALFGRSTTSQYGQFCAVADCAIDMSSKPSANGGKGSIAICNVASELFNIHSGYHKGDSALYFGSTNIYGVTSAYKILGGPTSCSSFTFSGMPTLHSYNPVGAPLVLRSAAFVNGEVYTANSSNDAGTRGFEFIGKQWSHDLRIFVEFGQRFGKCESLADCQIDILGSYTSKERYLEAGTNFNGFVNTEIKFLTTSDAAIVAPDYWLKNNAGDICRNLKIMAPAAPAIRFTVPTATNTNLINCEFVSNSSNGNSISRTQFITRTSAYTEVPLRLGSDRFWVDDFSMLRQKTSSDPSSATDGLPLAKLVVPPATATSAGAPGQWARSATFFYVYTGDGTTHTWVRAAVAAW